MKLRSTLLMSLSLVGLVGACQTTTSPNAPDAAPNGDGGNNGPDANTSCTNVLFLNFEGVTLNAGDENSATNTSSVTGQGTSTIPPFSHSALVSSIASQVQTALQPYHVSVVTTRPASGDYTMMVIGGTADDIGFSSPYTWLAPAIGCVPVSDGIGLVFEEQTEPDYGWGNLIIGTYGIMLGVPSSTTLNDCMCNLSDTCDNPTAACTIGGATVARDHDSPCGQGTDFDENGRFASALACP